MNYVQSIILTTTLSAPTLVAEAPIYTTTALCSLAPKNVSFFWRSNRILQICQHLQLKSHLVHMFNTVLILFKARFPSWKILTESEKLQERFQYSAMVSYGIAGMDSCEIAVTQEQQHRYPLNGFRKHLIGQHSLCPAPIKCISQIIQAVCALLYFRGLFTAWLVC